MFFFENSIHIGSCVTVAHFIIDAQATYAYFKNGGNLKSPRKSLSAFSKTTKRSQTVWHSITLSPLRIEHFAVIMLHTLLGSRYVFKSQWVFFFTFWFHASCEHEAGPRKHQWAQDFAAFLLDFVLTSTATARKFVPVYSVSQIFSTVAAIFVSWCIARLINMFVAIVSWWSVAIVAADVEV